MKHLTAIILLLSLLAPFAIAAEPPILRVTSTLQSYNIGKPWEKSSPYRRRGLGVVVGKNQILTTAEMVADATFIQLISADGEKSTAAKTIAVDYEANLALLSTLQGRGDSFVSELKPIEIQENAELGDSVNIIQLEDNGMQLSTQGKIRGADVLSSFINDHFFLTYQIKASMQSATNSYTIPVLKDNKLLGMLTSYDNEDQLVDCLAAEIVTAFLKDARDGSYHGFPSLGISTTSTNDQHFHRWLKLKDEQGGIYVSKVKRNSSAQKAGIKQGDVILKINKNTITRRGYYTSKHYGKIDWSHLTSGSKKVGQTIQLTIFRDGKEIIKDVKLSRPAEGLIPSNTYGKAPRYLIKGGFIFQELTLPYMQLFGKNWKTRAPIGLLDALNHPQDYEQGRTRLVFLSRTIPTDATLGYERINTSIINKVNGKDIADIPALIEAFKTPEVKGIHTIELDDNIKKIYLDATLSDTADHAFLRRGLPALYREKE